MQSSGKPKLADLNKLLTCVLCKGYFIDATTIVECLHSFCRTCIVRYLHTNKFCPSCEVQVHKTKPLLNIRSDQTLQDIVYKIVPGLFKNEMKRRRDYYQQDDELIQRFIPLTSEKRGDIWGCDRLIFTPEDIISVSLEYSPLNEQMTGNLKTNIKPVKNKESMPYYKRYFNCPGALKVHHLRKLLQAKYNLLNYQKKVHILYMHDLLKDQYTLVDLAYIYSWKRSEPLRLFFKIISEPQPSTESPKVSLANLSTPPLPSASNGISDASSMAAFPSSRHPSPPPSPQMAQEPNGIRVARPNATAKLHNITIPTHEKSMQGADKLPNVTDPDGHEKSLQGFAKLPNASVTDPDGHEKSLQGFAKLHNAAISETNTLGHEESMQDSAKSHDSAILEPTAVGDEESMQCSENPHSIEIPDSNDQHCADRAENVLDPKCLGIRKCKSSQCPVKHRTTSKQYTLQREKSIWVRHQAAKLRNAPIGVYDQNQTNGSAKRHIAPTYKQTSRPKKYKRYTKLIKNVLPIPNDQPCIDNVDITTALPPFKLGIRNFNSSHYARKCRKAFNSNPNGLLTEEKIWVSHRDGKLRNATDVSIENLQDITKSHDTEPKDSYEPNDLQIDETNGSAKDHNAYILEINGFRPEKWLPRLQVPDKFTNSVLDQDEYDKYDRRRRIKQKFISTMLAPDSLEDSNPLPEIISAVLLSPSDNTQVNTVLLERNVPMPGMTAQCLSIDQMPKERVADAQNSNSAAKHDSTLPEPKVINTYISMQNGLNADEYISTNEAQNSLVPEPEHLQNKLSTDEHNSSVPEPNSISTNMSIKSEHSSLKPNYTVLEQNGLHARQSVTKQKSAIVEQIVKLADKNIENKSKAVEHSCAVTMKNDIIADKNSENETNAVKHSCVVTKKNDIMPDNSTRNSRSAAKRNSGIMEKIDKVSKKFTRNRHSDVEHNSSVPETNSQADMDIHNVPSASKDNCAVQSVADKSTTNTHSDAQHNTVVLETCAIVANESIQSEHTSSNFQKSTLPQPNYLNEKPNLVAIHNSKVEKSSTVPDSAGIKTATPVLKRPSVNMSSPVVVLEKVDMSSIDVDDIKVVGLRRAQKKSTTPNNIMVNGHLAEENVSMPKLRSALKKNPKDKISSSVIEKQILVDSEFPKVMLSKKLLSPGIKKRVSFSVNLVQDGRDAKRKSPDYFAEEDAFLVSGSAMGGLIHLRKKVVPPKSS